MQSYKQFLEEMKKKKNRAVVVTAEPVHGRHSTHTKSSKRHVVVTSEPVHGRHSSRTKKRLKEEVTVSEPPVHGQHSENQEHVNENWESENDNKHIGENNSDIEKKLQDHYEHHNLPDKQRDAVKEYTRYSGELNRYLINTGRTDYDPRFSKYDYTEEEHENNREWTSHLDDAIGTKEAPHDIHVYHGLGNVHPGELASQSEDRTLKFPSYMSTSIDKTIAKQFAKQKPNKDTGEDEAHILHIKIPKGSRMAHGIFKHSRYEEEKEMLTARNMSYKIHPVPTVFHTPPSKYDPGIKYYVWHATPVED